MDYIFVLLLMIFCHIVDDYYLQGILASLKQKDWWKEHAPYKMYKYDYQMALFMHSFSWSFMIMLPLAVFYGFMINWLFIVLFICNLIIHAVVDNLKANKKKLNLTEDQIIHLIQIVATFLLEGFYG